MRKITLSAILIAAACTLLAAPGHAQTRVFVAAQGSDSNPCTFAQPCRSFQHAHDVVVAKGEIDVLDPAGYGALTITKSISIQGHGYSGVSVASGDAITINAGGADKVSLRGLLLDGLGSGANGIVFNSGALLTVQECVIRDFSVRGLNHQPITGVGALVMSDTTVSGTGSEGIQLVSGGGALQAVLERVQVQDTAGSGIAFFANLAGANIDAMVSSSVVNLTQNGITANALGGGSITVTVRNTDVTHASGTGLFSTGPGAAIIATRSAITGNNIGVGTASGSLGSYGDNNLHGNTTNGNFSPTGGLPYH